MATMKRSLTRREVAAHLARAKRMCARGVNIQIREEWLDTVRSLDITVGRGCSSTVFDLAGGSAAYAIWVRMVAQRRVALVECRLATDWDDGIDLIDDRKPLWRLGRQDFSGQRVLNMRIMNTLKFHGYDDTVEGMILATGRPMPEAYQHGMTVPFTLAFWDQNEDEIRQDAELFVDRTWRPKSKFVRQENSLHAPGEMPDPRRFNINKSRVPAFSDAEMHKNWEASRGPLSEHQSEVMALLRKAALEKI